MTLRVPEFEGQTGIPHLAVERDAHLHLQLGLGHEHLVAHRVLPGAAAHHEREVRRVELGNIHRVKRDGEDAIVRLRRRVQCAALHQLFVRANTGEEARLPEAARLHHPLHEG